MRRRGRRGAGGPACQRRTQGPAPRGTSCSTPCPAASPRRAATAAALTRCGASQACRAHTAPARSLFSQELVSARTCCGCAVARILRAQASNGNHVHMELSLDPDEVAVRKGNDVPDGRHAVGVRSSQTSGRLTHWRSSWARASASAASGRCTGGLGGTPMWLSSASSSRTSAPSSWRFVPVIAIRQSTQFCKSVTGNLSRLAL